MVIILKPFGELPESRNNFREVEDLLKSVNINLTNPRTTQLNRIFFINLSIFSRQQPLD
jgi:hypothetical protein